MKKGILSGMVFMSILLVSCNGEEKEGQGVESEQEAVVAPTNEENAELTLLSELKNEIIRSITEQTELDSESIAIMLDGLSFNSFFAVLARALAALASFSISLRVLS